MGHFVAGFRFAKDSNSGKKYTGIFVKFECQQALRIHYGALRQWESERQFCDRIQERKQEEERGTTTSTESKQFRDTCRFAKLKEEATVFKTRIFLDYLRLKNFRLYLIKYISDGTN